jgi:hypothetical protein
LPLVVASGVFSSQSSDLSNVALYSVSTAALYRVTVVEESAAFSGTLSTQVTTSIGWVDDEGAQNQIVNTGFMFNSSHGVEDPGLRAWPIRAVSGVISLSTSGINSDGNSGISLNIYYVVEKL